MLPTTSPRKTRMRSFCAGQDDLARDRGAGNPRLLLGAFAAVAVIGLTIIGGGLIKPGGSTTQPLEAAGQASASTSPDQPAGAVDLPAADATGEILTFDGVSVSREAANVQEVTVDPGTYANVNDWWSRADDQGIILLPKDTKVDQVKWFDSTDQSKAYAGNVGSSATRKVTVITLTGDLIGGFSSDQGTVVWYPQADFQADPAMILIPRDRDSHTGIFVGDTLYPLGLPKDA